MSQVNKRAVAAAFGRAAQSYDSHAQLQRQSADLLLAKLGECRPGCVLDAGCGPGSMSRYWRDTGDRSGSLSADAQTGAEPAGRPALRCGGH